MFKCLVLIFFLVINFVKFLFFDDEDEVKDLDDWDDFSVRVVDSFKEKCQSSIIWSIGDVFGLSKEDVDSIKFVIGFVVFFVFGFNYGKLIYFFF